MEVVEGNIKPAGENSTVVAGPVAQLRSTVESSSAQDDFRQLLNNTCIEGQNNLYAGVLRDRWASGNNSVAFSMRTRSMSKTQGTDQHPGDESASKMENELRFFNKVFQKTNTTAKAKYLPQKRRQENDKSNPDCTLPEQNKSELCRLEFEPDQKQNESGQEDVSSLHEELQNSKNEVFKSTSVPVVDIPINKNSKRMTAIDFWVNTETTVEFRDTLSLEDPQPQLFYDQTGINGSSSEYSETTNSMKHPQSHDEGISNKRLNFGLAGGGHGDSVKSRNSNFPKGGKLLQARNGATNNNTELFVDSFDNNQPLDTEGNKGEDFASIARISVVDSADCNSKQGVKDEITENDGSKERPKKRPRMNTGYEWNTSLDDVINNMNLTSNEQGCFPSHKSTRYDDNNRSHGRLYSNSQYPYHGGRGRGQFYRAEPFGYYSKYQQRDYWNGEGNRNYLTRGSRSRGPDQRYYWQKGDFNNTYHESRSHYCYNDRNKFGTSVTENFHWSSAPCKGASNTSTQGESKSIKENSVFVNSYDWEDVA